METEEKYIGCILGCAVGDAVGAPVEAKGTEHCQKYVTAHVKPKSFDHISRKSRSQKRYPFGQVTDDTQLTKELMESIVQCGKFNPHDFAHRVGEAFKENRVIGYGKSTRKAASRILKGQNWQEAGTPAPAAGNGSAMRAAPIGLLFWKKEQTDDLYLAATLQGICTHDNPLCSAGAIAIATSVSLAIRGEDPTKEVWWKHLAETVALADIEFGLDILHIWKARDWTSAQMLKALRTYNVDLPGTRVWDGISPYVRPSVLWALFSFLKSPDDFWKTIQTSIWCGGDVDSTAAMAGAISGAYNGADAIPKQVVEKVHDRDLWSASDLILISKKLHEMVHVRDPLHKSLPEEV